MKQRRVSAVLFPIFLVAMVLPGIIEAQAARQGPMFGTWKLNVAKSDFGESPKPISMLVKVESDTAELIQFSVTMSVAMGTYSYTYKGVADGKDYPAVGTASTYAYTEENGVVTETEKDADGTVLKGTFAISKDGRIGTWTYTVTDSAGNVTHEKLIYDRQNS